MSIVAILLAGGCASRPNPAAVPFPGLAPTQTAAAASPQTAPVAAPSKSPARSREQCVNPTGMLPDSSWFEERHLRPEDMGGLYDCSPVRVGLPLRDGLLCTEVMPMPGDLPGGARVFGVAIVTAERGVMQTLLRVPFSAGPQDRMGCKELENYYVRLAIEMGGDGTTLTLRERPEFPCANYDPHIEPFSLVVRRVCPSVGRYKWKDGKFRGPLP